MKILTITARRWEGAYEGDWELYDRDHILTQVTRLKDARQQIIDLFGDGRSKDFPRWLGHQNCVNTVVVAVQETTTHLTRPGR